MQRLDIAGVLLLLLIILPLITSAIDLALLVPNKKDCTMERVQRLVAYNCNNLKYKEVPQNLQSGAEIIDLSENRIRDLTVGSFRRYTSLKYLYLHENKIQTVEPGTFSQLTSLEALDLSSNALTTVPLEIFQISALRNLYVADNNLFDLAKDLEDLSTPIAAPLQIVSFSSCTLKEIPKLGVLPNLLHANFSLNPLTYIDVVQLAPMCNLKTVDLNGTSFSGCLCHSVRSYLLSLKVFIKNGPFYCDKSGAAAAAACPPSSSNATLQIYSECLATKEALVEEERKSSILFYAGIAGGCLLVIVLLSCCCARNRKISKKREQQKQAAAARRRARKSKSEEAMRLMLRDGATDQSSLTKQQLLLSGEERGHDVIQVDIEKAPPGD